jgi:hypothetical protein
MNMSCLANLPRIGCRTAPLSSDPTARKHTPITFHNPAAPRAERFAA